MTSIDLAHHVPVIRNQSLDLVCLVQELVPLFILVIERIAFALAPISRAAAADLPQIKMDPPAPHRPQRAPLIQLREEAASPIKIASIRARAYKGQPFAIVRHPRSEAPVFGGVFFRREVPTAAPRF